LNELWNTAPRAETIHLVEKDSINWTLQIKRIKRRLAKALMVKRRNRPRSPVQRDALLVLLGVTVVDHKSVRKCLRPETIEES
jgi:hypothetical protein